MKSLAQLMPVLAFGFLLPSCTTMQGLKQSVKVVSAPPGAEVIVDGTAIGKTPGFFELYRKRSRTVTLQKPGYMLKNIELPTSYRWGDSLISNIFVFYGYSPAAWAIDYLDGSAFDYGRAGIISLEKDPSTPKETREPVAPIKVIAVAPPQSDFGPLSFEVRERLEHEMATKYPGASILKSDKSDFIFQEYTYDFESPIGDHYRDEFYKDLKASHLLESKIERNQDSLKVKAKLVNVFTDKNDSEFETIYKNTEFASAQRSHKAEFLIGLASLIPNTLAIDIAPPTVDAAIAPPSDPTNTYKAVTKQDTGAMGFINSLSVANLKGPKVGNSLKPIFRWSSALAFRQRQFSFSTENPNNVLQGCNFGFSSAFFGVGPEVGLESLAGYLFTSIVPVYSVNWVWGNGNGQSASMAYGSLGFATSVGFQFYVTDRISISIFVKANNINTTAFDSVASEIAGQPIVATKTNIGIAGFEFGYYFPEAKKKIMGSL